MAESARASLRGAWRWSLVAAVVAAPSLVGCASAEPKDPERRRELEMTRSALEGDFFFQRAIEVRKAGRVEQAALYLRRVLGRDPAHEGAIGMLAELLIDRNDLEAAVELLEGAARRLPERGYLHFALGVASEARGDLARAGRAFAEAARLEPTEPAALVALGRLEALRGNAEEAARALHAAALRAPRNADVWLALGELAERDGKLEDAERSYRKGLEVDPAAAAVLHALALLLERQEREEALLDLAGRVDAEAWAGAGAVAARLAGGAALRLGRLAVARVMLRRAAEHASASSGEVHFLLGEAMRRSGIQAEAEAAMRVAAQREPARALYHVGLGRTLLALERPAEALHAFERAMRLDPKAEYMQHFRDAARGVAAAAAAPAPRRGE